MSFAGKKRERDGKGRKRDKDEQTGEEKEERKEEEEEKKSNHGDSNTEVDPEVAPASELDPDRNSESSNVDLAGCNDSHSREPSADIDSADTPGQGDLLPECTDHADVSNPISQSSIPAVSDPEHCQREDKGLSKPSSLLEDKRESETENCLCESVSSERTSTPPLEAGSQYATIPREILGDIDTDTKSPSVSQASPSVSSSSPSASLSSPAPSPSATVASLSPASSGGSSQSQTPASSLELPSSTSVSQLSTQSSGSSHHSGSSLSHQHASYRSSSTVPNRPTNQISGRGYNPPNHHPASAVPSPRSLPSMSAKRPWSPPSQQCQGSSLLGSPAVSSLGAASSVIPCKKPRLNGYHGSIGHVGGHSVPTSVPLMVHSIPHPSTVPLSGQYSAMVPSTSQGYGASVSSPLQVKLPHLGVPGLQGVSYPLQLSVPQPDLSLPTLYGATPTVPCPNLTQEGSLLPTPQPRSLGGDTPQDYLTIPQHPLQVQMPSNQPDPVQGSSVLQPSSVLPSGSNLLQPGSTLLNHSSLMSNGSVLGGSGLLSAGLPRGAPGLHYATQIEAISIQALQGSSGASYPQCNYPQSMTDSAPRSDLAQSRLLSLSGTSTLPGSTTTQLLPQSQLTSAVGESAHSSLTTPVTCTTRTATKYTSASVPTSTTSSVATSELSAATSGGSNSLDPVSQAVLANYMGILPRKRKKEIPCDVCDMTFDSDTKAEAHFHGSKHARKAKLADFREEGKAKFILYTKTTCAI